MSWKAYKIEFRTKAPFLPPELAVEVSVTMHTETQYPDTARGPPTCIKQPIMMLTRTMTTASVSLSVIQELHTHSTTVLLRSKLKMAVRINISKVEISLIETYKLPCTLEALRHHALK